MEKVPYCGSSLDVAARYYFYKPMAVFFNAFHLRAYHTAGVRLRSPVLDIGCGDGSFGAMLAEVMESPQDMRGVDLERRAIRRAGKKARSLYRDMICANATNLPFGDQTFRTVISCASLLSIDPGLDGAMKEAHRVMAPGGSFYVTVCTDQYEQNYWLTRLLHRVGCRKLARRYMNSMNRRMQQAHLYSPDDWVRLFERHGFRVANTFGFFPLSLTPLWSFLAWTPLRLHSAVKLIPSAWLHDRLRALYRRSFEPVYMRTDARLVPDDCGYIFIEAVKEG